MSVESNGRWLEYVEVCRGGAAFGCLYYEWGEVMVVYWLKKVKHHTRYDPKAPTTAITPTPSRRGRLGHDKYSIYCNQNIQSARDRLLLALDVLRPIKVVYLC